MKEQKNQTFNDGVVKVYRLEDIQEGGNLPVRGEVLKETLRYRERTVGMTRYNLNLQNNARIDRLLRVQKRRNISTQDIAIPNDGHRYIVRQAQYIEGLDVMDLSLERLDEDYDAD